MELVLESPLSRRLQCVVGLLLLVVVLFIIVAPSVELEPSAMRSQRAALLAMATLFAAATSTVGVILHLNTLLTAQFTVLEDVRSCDKPDLLNSLCAWLC